MMFIPRAACASVLTFALALGTVGVAELPAAAADQTLKIGVELPVSGTDGSDGIPMENAVVLAVDEANQHAPKGLRFEVDALDDAVNGIHNPQAGVTNIRSLAADSAVVGVVGPYNSNVAAAEVPVSNEALLPLISPAATNPVLTTAKYRTAHPNQIAFFRISAGDDRQGRAGAYVAKQLGYKHVYVIDDNETFGVGLADVFQDSAKSLGLTILGRDHLIANQQDFSSLLTRIAPMHPDAIYYGGTTSTGGALLRKQMGSAGMAKVPFLSSDGIYDDAFPKIAGAAADGTYFTNASPSIDKLASAQSFIKAFEAKFHHPPTGFAANAYVAAQVIIAASEKAVVQNGGKTPTRSDVLKNIRDTKDFHSIVGTFSFDRNGDTTNPAMALWSIKNEKQVYVRAINMTAVAKSEK